MPGHVCPRSNEKETSSNPSIRLTEVMEDMPELPESDLKESETVHFMNHYGAADDNPSVFTLSVLNQEDAQVKDNEPGY
jgi:hypothetical protein